MSEVVANKAFLEGDFIQSYLEFSFNEIFKNNDNNISNYTTLLL